MYTSKVKKLKTLYKLFYSNDDEILFYTHYAHKGVLLIFQEKFFYLGRELNPEPPAL